MIFLRNSLYVSICCLSLVLPTLVHADAPVVDATSQDSNDNSNSDSADYANSPDSNTATTNNNNFPSAAVPNINSNSAPTSQPQAISNSSNNSYDTSSMSLNDRVAQLERQIANMNQLNLLGQVNQLQQQVQDLTGQLETATHNLQVLQNQQKNQYADLDQRLSKLENPSAKTVPASNANSATNNNADTSTSTDNQQTTTDSSSTSTGDDATPTPSSQNNSSSSDNQVSNALQEQTDYQKAYNLIKNKNYSGATTSMVQFLKQYPNSSYALNAHYWLGEMYLLQNMPGQAATEFNAVINKYPQNPKTGDAMLKLGFAYADQQKWPQARKQLLLVSSRYSGSSTGQLAAERLKEMKLQGH